MPKWLTTKNIQKTLAIQVASIWGGDGENYMILPKDCLVVFFCFNGGLHPRKRFVREILNEEIMVQFLMHISKNRAKIGNFC